MPVLRRTAHLVLRLAGLLLSVCSMQTTAAESSVVVVMAPGSAPLTLSADELAAVFRKQRLFVAGTRVQPVNLPATHPLRRWFSQRVLERSPEELEGFWRDQYFSGTAPPFVLASEEAVIRFVAANAGALGYVSGCVVDRRVRVLLQFDGGPPCGR